jgi:putative DNA primase/helicase
MMAKLRPQKGAEKPRIEKTSGSYLSPSPIPRRSTRDARSQSRTASGSDAWAPSYSPILERFLALPWLVELGIVTRSQFGPPRSGKGTTGRVLKGLLGSTNYTAVTLQSLGGEFGMEHLIGKKLALVADVKLDGRMNVTTIMQRLLETIGEDDQSINRKNQKFWEGKLGIPWLILGNDIPRFRGTDEAGALAARMVMLKMEQSFLGREDWDLTEKLLAERAGILNWSMEGWRRLRVRDGFIQPASGLELLNKLRASTSTIGMFVMECCELGAEFKVEHAILWAAFCEWSGRKGLSLTLGTNTFSGALHAIFESVTTTRPRAGMPSERPLFQYGIKLKDGWCPWRH